MPREVKLETATDFRAGLNLRADAFQLRPGESPDLLNMDVDPRGGFRIRQGIAPLNSTALTADPTEVWTFWNGSSTHQVLARDATRVSYSTGGNFTTAKTYGSTPATIRAATFNNKNYWVTGDLAVVKWDGTTATDLTATYNDDIAAPNDGDMPRAELIASWNDYVWVANTWESGTNFPNRVRFSHPNRAEDWRTDDFIDVSVGANGDEITALIPLSDRLLVFKRQSVHAIFGYSPDTFQVTPITQTTGAVRQEAVRANENVVYWFNWPGGVFSYNGKEVQWEFERLISLIRDGTIPADFQDKIAVAWLDRRIWVSVPEGANTVNSATYVFDPSLGKEGGWTKYSFGVAAMWEWRLPNDDAIELGCGYNKRVLKLVTAARQDDFGSGLVDIISYYKTNWFDGGSPIIKKRWRRGEFVLDSDFDVLINVDVFHDYNPSTVYKRFQLETTSPLSTPLWGTAQWGLFQWGGSAMGSQEIDRGATLGARSVQLKFSQDLNFSDSSEWGVSSIGLKYIPKRLR